MDKEAVSAIFLLTLPIIILSSPTAAYQYLFTLCSNRTSYTPNSPFENNLKLLLQGLPSNTSSTGFNNTSIGQSPDQLYGQALCRGDINSTVCQSCVANASQKIFRDCKSKDAIIWYDFCQVRYSFQMFFEWQFYAGQYPDWDTQEKNVSNPVYFNQLVMYLLNNLSSETAFNPSRQMFATGEMKFTGNQTIYGLVQCTRDISQADCYKCLTSTFGDLRGCCSSKQGGIILSRNCNVRFEMYSFYNSSMYFLTYPTSQGNRWKIWLLACIAIVILAILVGSLFVYLRQKKRREQAEEIAQSALLMELTTPQCDVVNPENLPFMDLNIIKAATDNFAVSNKLGQGGFGTVYKGLLPNGKEIAVKRLSRKSWQGFDEMKNEIILIAKLQHRNLVRLLGCGIEGEEKLLIYEFMPNRSLDLFIFDSERRALLDWTTCYYIISGIARGLLYLHEDSRLKIIHRDLKPSNVLLDQEMVAKISDFGMARIFSENQNTVNTRRVVGTYGYMAPEYAMSGLFSVKSDVFSFGVILLEIISGKRSSGFYRTEYAQTLLAYAWKLWNEGKELEFADPLMVEADSISQVIRCIHIGLLCVQEDPSDRPTMSSVVVLLGGEPIALPQPKQPPISASRMVPVDKIFNT